MTKPEGTEHVLECAECGRPSPPEARGWRTYLDDDEQAVTFCEPERAAVADASRSASESRSPRLSPLGCVHGVLDPEQVSVMEKVFRFSLHGRAGTVTVTYRTNEDPSVGGTRCWIFRGRRASRMGCLCWRLACHLHSKAMQP